MATCLKSFHIYNMTYDADVLELTFEFDVNGSHSKRVHLGARTDDDIAADVKKILNQFYAVESES